MKKLSLIPLFLITTTAVNAVTFTDNFDSLGNGTALETDSNWTLEIGGSFTGRSDGELLGVGGGPNLSTLSTAVLTLNDGEDFKMSADIIQPSGVDGGLVFGYQDSNNYYVAKLVQGSDKFQFIRRIGGVDNALVNDSIALGTTGYNLDLDYTASTDTVAITVTDINSSSTIYSNSIIDSTYTNGAFGLFSRFGAAQRFDNLSVETISSIPEASHFSIALASVAAFGAIARRKLRKQ